MPKHLVSATIKEYFMNLSRYIPQMLIAFITLLVISPAALAQDGEIPWTSGPATVDIGNSLSELDLADAYAFTGAKDTQTIMESMGNPISGTEVGLLVPTAEDQDWFIVFEYEAVGYIPDDEKDELDAAAILASVREGTEAANEYRAEQGIAPLTVKGWHTEPFYDERTNNLTWTILAESEDEYGVSESVNHNVRILGRTGYMSAVLVADPSELSQLIPETEAILSGFRYKDGKTYAEYIQGDKLAGYGLTALVAGGVGAAAAKTGILQLLLKNIKLVLIAAFASLAAAWKWIAGLFTGRDQYAVDRSGENSALDA